ncbi:DUF3365 domain-containing protein [Lujinxingia sediminis]|uniref:DUF3365 domain-containing protein n=2 Tax=Lujinxingia sediminis TaxID=2480984 RepID=A0ABY0CTZ5_9DELT|nr:DUF3365 domain-containing protein [Lujinxingia sediminis]
MLMKRDGEYGTRIWSIAPRWPALLLGGAMVLGACERGPETAAPEEVAAQAETEKEKHSTDAPDTVSSEEEAQDRPALPEGWNLLQAERLSAEQRAQLERAEAARKALASTLMGRVMGVVQEKGAPAAVEVCHSEAGPLTAEVGEEHGVRIGRFSEKLRNADNQPPPWAAAVANEAGEPRVGVGPQQELAVLSPIRIAAPCLTCHGDRESLAPQVARAIAEYYPEDRATGYAEGDLRGWFWVEVPGS